MKTKSLVLALILTAFSPFAVFAQTATPVPADNTQHVVIDVRQAPADKPAAVATKIEQANEWVDFGKHVGGAMREGLSALTDEANKFSGTPAGKFTMAVIAWKVAGKEAMELTNRLVGIVIGLPFVVAWLSIGFWVIRKNFMIHKEITKKSGFWLWAAKEYQIVNPWSKDRESYRGSNEAKAGAMIITFAIFLIPSFIVLGAII